MSKTTVTAPTEKKYDIPASFWKWLEENRPHATTVIRKHGYTTALLAVGAGRARLRFPTIDTKESIEFDRQLHDSCACVVIDGHPDTKGMN